MPHGVKGYIGMVTVMFDVLELNSVKLKNNYMAIFLSVLLDREMSMFLIKT